MRRIALLALLLAGCAGATSTPPVPTAAPATTTPSSAGSPVPSVDTSTQPGGPVPAALSGVWHTNNGGDDQKLSFNGNSYKVYVVLSDAAVGTVTVSGDQITFSGSTTCAGAGTYQWAIAGANLRFTLVGIDPCPRSGLLPGRDWTRE